MILPVVSVMNVPSVGGRMIGVLNPYLWTWCGFYGAVLVTKVGKALGTVASGEPEGDEQSRG